MIDIVMHTCIEVTTIQRFSERIKRLNVRARFRFNEKTWPPTSVKDYTPLVLIHHQDQYSAKQSAEISKLVHSGEIHQGVSKTSDSKSFKRTLMVQQKNLSIVK